MLKLKRIKSSSLLVQVALSLLAMSLLVACSGGDKASGDPGMTPAPPPVAKRLELKTNTQLIIADGRSEATLTITAYDENNKAIVNPDYTIYVNGEPSKNRKISSSIAGEYNVYAKVGLAESDSVHITARESLDYGVPGISPP
jgi:hypothetical protein